MNQIETLRPRIGLQRLGSLVRDDRVVSLSEISVLMTCGVAAAVAICVFRGQRWGIPGHAVLRATLPIAMGLAVVPRRLSGTMISTFGGIATVALLFTGAGRLPVPAFVAMCAFGPALDLAIAGRFAKIHSYVRFIVAGIIANLLALTVLLSRLWFGWDELRQLVSWYVISYIICGALAGAVSAVVCFQSSRRKADSTSD